jgi:acyl-phosphate glycerol 3-phosphate acyltransferase
MTTLALSALAVLVAYLLGSIPFGFLTAKAVAGIDIRTVGSGNIGATNVGRTLGFRYFLLVTLLDGAKGYLPTYFFPRLIGESVGSPVPDLAPLVALATILGHNFPIFLGFKGGKGVATSLGAVTALNPIASLGAVLGFLAFISLTSYVSLASLAGGLVFVGLHFAHMPAPFDREHRTLSVLIFGLLALLFYRHRKNLARIASGTEPKVSFRRKRQPSGRVRIGLLVGLAVAVLAVSALVANAFRRLELDADGRHFVQVARLATGQQRAERLAFLDGGRFLVATCPRYTCVVLARVTDPPGLELLREIPTEGRAVAISGAKDRFYVLVRPHADARHLEQAWLQAFDFQGEPMGDRVRVGWDPDDMALSANGRFAYILTSGNAEGETNRPPPALITFDLNATPPKALGRVSFEAPKDDPERLILLPDDRAAVSLRGSNSVAILDVSDSRLPKLIDRFPVPEPCVPEALAVDNSGHLLVADPEASAYWRLDGDLFTRVDVEDGVADLLNADGLLLATLPRGSGLAVLSAQSHLKLGRLPIRGLANLAATRPLGIAYSADRNLIAVSNRAGGSLHLIAIE